MSEKAYKDLNPDGDILYTQKTELEELFYPQQALVKPYNSTNNLVIETTDAPTEDPDIYNQISYLKNENSNINYFSYARAVKDQFTAGEYSGLMYSYMKSLVHPNRDNYRVNDGTSEFDVTEFDVLSVTREWYKDSIDPEFFAVFINTEASTPTTTPAGFASTDGVLGLFPSEKEHTSRLGDKRYLYPTTLTTDLYDSGTDTLTMVDDADLDKSTPYGEILIESGLVILYYSVIKTNHANATTDQTALHYVAGIAGRSRTQVNATIFFCRATNTEFNYTTNRTFYRDDAENVIKQEFRENPTTFITTVGLYNNKDQCIAFGRLSKPVKKDFTRESNIVAEIYL